MIFFLIQDFHLQHPAGKEVQIIHYSLINLPNRSPEILSLLSYKPQRNNHQKIECNRRASLQKQDCNASTSWFPKEQTFIKEMHVSSCIIILHCNGMNWYFNLHSGGKIHFRLLKAGRILIILGASMNTDDKIPFYWLIFQDVNFTNKAKIYCLSPMVLEMLLMKCYLAQS